MNITILTPYKLFFITQADLLFALMKDGRVLKVKQVPYFSNISSDGKVLTGISFDGENTHILSTPFGFDVVPQKETASLFGYFYYPTLSQDGKKMAVVEADLLKPRPEGELRIYKRKIKKWYLLNSFDARMKPPFMSQKDDSLFFIDNQNNLVQYSNETFDKIAENVSCFSLSKAQNKIVFFSDSKICVYSLQRRQTEISFPAKDVTALCFDNAANEVLFATSTENRFAIYSQNIQTNKTTLLTQADEQICFLST